MLASIEVWAQKELRINEVFTQYRQQMKESYVRGEALRGYRLDIMRTGKLTVSAGRRDDIEALFLEDIKDVPDRTQDNSEMEVRDGHLYYAVVQLADYKGRHRYVCYQCKHVESGKYEITLAYMRGTATMSDLRNTFKHK